MDASLVPFEINSSEEKCSLSCEAQEWRIFHHETMLCLSLIHIQFGAHWIQLSPTMRLI